MRFVNGMYYCWAYYMIQFSMSHERAEHVKPWLATIHDTNGLMENWTGFKQKLSFNQFNMGILKT